MSERISIWEKGLIGFGLLLSTAAIFPIFDGSAASADPTGRDLFTEHLWWLVYAILLVVVIPLYRRVLELAASMPALLLLVGWASMSAIWSDAPSLTLRRSAALFLTTLFALYLAARLSRREFIQVFSVGLAAITILSLVMAMAMPRYGLDHLRGDAWRGVFATKNGLGRIACLTLAVWLYRARAYKTPVAVVAVVVSVSMIDIYFAHSRTSLVVGLFLVLFLMTAPLLQGDFRIATATSMFLVIAAGSATFWLYNHSGEAFASVGASDNLTGRTTIWSGAWYMIQRHYWIGYGYNAFWTGINGPAGELWGIIGSTPPHAHNGFLDTWLDIGAIGVLLLVVFLARTGVRAWLSMRSGDLDNAWSLLFLVYLLAFNLSESSFLSRNSIFWLMFVLATAWVVPERASGRALSRAARTSRSLPSLSETP